MRRLLALTLTLALLAGVLPALAQNESITVNDIRPAITTRSQKIGPSDSAQVEITTSGEFKQTVGHSDSWAFVPAVGSCAGNTTNLTPTRVAASDWGLGRTATAGGEVIHITCSLNTWLNRLTGGTKGVKISSINIHHRINTIAIAATWGKIATVAFANNTANAVDADRATTPSLPTAVQTEPYLTSVTLATPIYMPLAANQAFNLEYAVELGMPSGQYVLYGLTVYFTRLDH